MVIKGHTGPAGMELEAGQAGNTPDPTTVSVLSSRLQQNQTRTEKPQRG